MSILSTKTFPSVVGARWTYFLKAMTKGFLILILRVRKFDICGEFARWTDIMMGILSENHGSHGVSAEGTKDEVKQTRRAKT